MSLLSLSKNLSIVFPTEMNGYPIDADFKNILWILDYMNDPNIDERTKIVYALRYFFIEDIPDDGVRLMTEFINKDDGSQGGDMDGGAVLDYEYDADEIYCDFLRAYGIDLFQTDMHWYKFLTLLNGLEKGALRQKLQARTLDLSKLKGKDRTDAQRIKQRAQIPVRYTAQELAEIAEFEKWGE